MSLEAYESSRIYKERAKKWHEKHITKKRFEEGDMVLFNSRLKFFLKKLRSRWSGPFQLAKVIPSGVVKVWSKAYLVRQPIAKAAIYSPLYPLDK